MVEELAEKAACRNETDVFFSKDSVDVRMALAMCRTCPVLEVCRDYAPFADRRGVFGVMAGMTERQRRSMRGGRRTLIGDLGRTA